MRTWILPFLLISVPAASLAQDEAAQSGVRSEDEIPDDMPEAPEDAPPAEAPAVGATDDRPPHPKTPDPLAEPQPDAEMLANTMYHWLPGRWVWTGEQFEWKNGIWIYKVKDMILVPPRWEWNEKRTQWVFHDGGWAKPGTNVAVYSPSPAPGAPEVTGNAETAPTDSSEPTEQQQAHVTVYVWTGVYYPPVIVYPRWHPHYHYHWYHRHPHYRAAPAYRHRRYHYANTHHRVHHHGSRPPSSHPGYRASQPSTKPSQPATRPSQPSTRPPDKSSAQRTQQRSYGGTRRSRSGRRR